MSQPSYVMRVHRAQQAPTDHEFSQAKVTVGREVGDLVLRDPGASSRHAELVFQDGVLTFRDTGSTNGSWIGSRKLTEEKLSVGARVTIGGCTLEVVEFRGLGTMVLPQPAAAAPGTQIQRPPAAPAPHQPAAAPSAGNQRLVLVGALAVAIGVSLFVVLRRGGEAPKDPGTGTQQPLAGGAGTGSGTGATPRSANGATKLAQPRSATVKAVWFRGPLGPQASGGTSGTTVRLSPNASGSAAVGVMEEFAGGAGNQWRTATWLASFASSQITGHTLTDHEFLVQTRGHIDGPSAGMLITSTMIALLRGKTPREDTTMTGTINPDGSAGPVGGIVQKMEGASKDGIKRFGFPMGARNHQDLRTGRTVDLFEAGKEFGLEVREIRDVFEAYEFLTGDKLARPEPVSESEMELDGDTSARLRSKNEKWRARLESEIANIGSFVRGLGDEQKGVIGPIANNADAQWKRAQEFERSDFLGSAYEGFVQAAVLAGITKDAARFLKSAGDLDDMVQQVRAAATVRGQLSAMLNEAELRAKRKTGGGQINTLRAYQSAVTADAFAAQADGAVETVDALLKAQKEGKATQEQVEKIPEFMFQAISYYSVAKTMLDVAEDQKDFGNEEGQSPPIAPEVIGKFASAYGSAAGAVMQYLESLTIEEAAQKAGIDKATAQARFAANDTDYLFALRAGRIAEHVDGKKNETNLLRLAAGSMAFLKGASLVNKYYSLGGETDQNGTLTLTNRKALAAQLDLGRQLAREAAARAKQAVGYVPIASRLAYQLGVAKREGDDQEKLAALESYWESAFWSELASSGAR